MTGNEVADQYGCQAAGKPPVRQNFGEDQVGIASFKRKRAEKAAEPRREDITKEKRVFRTPRTDTRPGVRKQLQTAPKAVITRFY